MKQRTFATLFAAVLALWATPVPAQAQSVQSVQSPQAPAQQQPVQQFPQGFPVQVYPGGMDASSVRDQLQEILRQYPPAVGEVLRRDPSLLNRPDYISPYPQLVLFLQQYPEIARNPQFYFGGYVY